MFSVSLLVVLQFLTILTAVFVTIGHSYVILNGTNKEVINFETIGGIPDDKSLSTCWKNTLLLNQTLASLKNGSTLLVPSNKTFWLMGGRYARELSYVTIQIDGILKFSDNEHEWPRNPNTHLVLDCFYFEQIDHVTFTSSQSLNKKGIIDGSGNRWWGLVEYLVIHGD